MLIFLDVPFGIARATHEVVGRALGLGSTLRHLKDGGLAVREGSLFPGAGRPVLCLARR
jgi:uncharacterized protein